MADSLRVSGTRFRAFLADDFAQTKERMVADWHKHRWGNVVCCGIAATYILDRLITDLMKFRLPFTPQYKFYHGYVKLFEQSMLGNKAPMETLLNEIWLYSTIVECSIAFIVGLCMGWLLTQRPILAAFIAVFPQWFILTTCGILFSRVLLLLSDFSRSGVTHLSGIEICVGILTSTPILAAAVLGSLIAQLVRKAINNRRTLMQGL
jgi:hypothetical protein